MKAWICCKRTKLEHEYAEREQQKLQFVEQEQHDMNMNWNAVSLDLGETPYSVGSMNLKNEKKDKRHGQPIQYINVWRPAKGHEKKFLNLFLSQTRAPEIQKPPNTNIPMVEVMEEDIQRLLSVSHLIIEVEYEEIQQPPSVNHPIIEIREDKIERLLSVDYHREEAKEHEVNSLKKSGAWYKPVCKCWIFFQRSQRGRDRLLKTREVDNTHWHEFQEVTNEIHWCKLYHVANNMANQFKMNNDIDW